MTQPEAIEVRVPVLIVGAGPAGLTASLLLRQLGVEALTVTRYGWTANSPRAHYQNQRSIEILRELGLEEEVMACGLPEHLFRNVVWASSLNGAEFARLPTYMAARRDDYLGASPCGSSNIPQHLLEPIMARAAMQRGAAIRWNQELLDLSQDAEGVTALMRDRISGREYRIHAQYVIGADGARSRVVEALGIGLQGPQGWAAAVNVWFRADLARYCEHRPGVLYWINRPGNDFWVGSGAFVNVRPWNEWVLSFMYAPDQGLPDLSPEALSARIRGLVGDERLAVEVLSSSPWQMNAQVAERMALGRVFIAGDAAHRHPPSGGLGSNTSMQDAYNLAWKLKLVLDGQAAPALLDSYDVERRPVAQQVVARSMQSVQELGAVAAAIGFSPQQSEEEGWQAYAELSEPGPKGKAKRQALREAIALQQYHFCAHGVELGVRYREGALLADPALDEGQPARDPQIHYQPLAHPGCHLPHAWLEKDGRRLSTLDITGNGRFVLLLGHDAWAWEQAAAAVREALGVPLAVARLGVGLDYADVLGQWTALSGIEDDGCLLVRPDKVIAWRCASLPRDPRADLRNALAQILGLTPSLQ